MVEKWHPSWRRGLNMWRVRNRPDWLHFLIDGLRLFLLGLVVHIALNLIFGHRTTRCPRPIDRHWTDLGDGTFGSALSAADIWECPTCTGGCRAARKSWAPSMKTIKIIM